MGVFIGRRFILIKRHTYQLSTSAGVHQNCHSQLIEVPRIRGETTIFLLEEGVFGEFALPNYIIPCGVIGVRVKNFFFVWGGGVAGVHLPDERRSC